MKVILVSGIWRPEHCRSRFADRMLTELRMLGYKTHDVRYPKLWTLQAYIPSQLRARAEYIVRAHRTGDAVVAHSAGCLLTWVAMRLGARFGTVFFFGAAAEDDITFPQGGMRRLYNVFSSDDRALRLGRLLPWHPFGSMGLHGYRGADKRVRNIMAPGHDHHDYTAPEHIRQWVSLIDSKLRRNRHALDSQ